MTALPDPFYLIVDHVDWLHRLLPLGVRLVQLRIKDRTETETRAQIRMARELCRAHGTQLVINDYWSLALEENCDFVHLGQEDLDSADLTALRLHNVRVGISSHDEAELERALRCQPDYVALGPIYPTRLKKMPWAPQGLPRIGQWKRRIGALPLVAIGGLDPQRAEAALAAGADAVAVVTDIRLHVDPEARMRQWIEAIGALA